MREGKRLGLSAVRDLREVGNQKVLRPAPSATLPALPLPALFLSTT